VAELRGLGTTVFRPEPDVNEVMRC
jgi:hypothetical protein